MPTTLTPSRSRSATPPRPAAPAPTRDAALALGDLPDGKHRAHGAEAKRPPQGADVVRWHPWPAGLMRPAAPPRAPVLAQAAGAGKGADSDPPVLAVAIRTPDRPTTPARRDPLQEGLYRLMDRLSFRGALAPLISGCAKWALASKAGTGSALDGWIGPALAASCLQLLAGACLPGDREHGFRWGGALLPSADLLPPPSVARWGVYAADEDQNLLRRIDHLRRALRPTPGLALGAPAEFPKRLEEAEERLHQRLLRDRDWLDLGAALAMFGALATDVLAAAAAEDDRYEGRQSPTALAGVLTLLMTAFLLDTAAGLWQMRARRPRPEDFPGPQ